MIAILIGLAILAGAGSAALAWSHTLRVRGATSGEAAALANALKRVPEADRLAELARRSASPSWERHLAEATLACPDDDARIATVNEALSDVEHALSERAGWPTAGVRIAALAGLLLAAAAYLESREPKWSLAIAALAGVAALSCVEAGRAARTSAAAQRAAVDALVAAALGRLAAAPSPAPGAPRPDRAATSRRSGRRRPGAA